MEQPAELDFKQIQSDLANVAEKVCQMTFAANSSHPVKDGDTIRMTFEKLSECCPDKLSSLQIMPKYCKFDAEKKFYHAKNCFCQLGVLDPDASEASLLNPSRLADDTIVEFIRSIPQGHSLWKAFHSLVVSGTSSYFMAGGTTKYKHWIVEFAIRFGLVTEYFDSTQLLNMTGGKQYEDPIRKRYSKHLAATISTSSTGGKQVEIVSGDGLRVPREKRLRILGHSNDGEIPATNEMFELKVKNFLPHSPTIEPNYMAQLQQGLLITERWRCRYLTAKKPVTNSAKIISREYLVPINVDYLKVLVARITYGCSCVFLKRLPSEEAFSKLGMFPTVNFVAKDLIF